MGGVGQQGKTLNEMKTKQFHKQLLPLTDSKVLFENINYQGLGLSFILLLYTAL